MTRGTVLLASAAVLWCAYVIATTFDPSSPALPSTAAYLPGFLLLPVVAHTLHRARQDALLCLAHVPATVLAAGFAVAVTGWLFSCGALVGRPGTELLSAIAGMVIVLHVAFGLIAVGLVRSGG
ncbi:hypothetical protein [Actinosynnema mirum]|uniref:Uncharacterized protein n=2 Tax=Actinosynnema TaxID=40566 RepID=C6W9A5_ACTMD|nr:hypothetical protein [Actinosynnema mirum]ACU35268.1 hypothetical protein Amir_1316 [Actinosynnema mirum DSM 43827]AXX28641.1 hypothetical protein APASM_1276 [Actinosynnema pretiosum subsp. pretiosum]